MVNLIGPGHKYQFPFSCILGGGLHQRSPVLTFEGPSLQGSVEGWCNAMINNVTSITDMILGNNRSKEINTVSCKQVLKSPVLVVNYSTAAIFSCGRYKINQEECIGQCLKRWFPDLNRERWCLDPTKNLSMHRLDHKRCISHSSLPISMNKLWYLT